MYTHNLMEKAKNAYESGDHKEALRYLLRLNEFKMDLIWEFGTQKAISSLCVAKYKKPFGKKGTQIVIGSEDNIVYSLSLDKEPRWQFCIAEDEITSVISYDLNNDLSEEIIIGSKDNNVYVLNSKGRLLWRYKTDSPIKCMAAVDIDGKKIIVAGSFDGSIYFIEYKADLFWKYCHKKGRTIKGLCVAELIHDDHPEIVAVTDSGDVLILDYYNRVLVRQFKLKGSLYGVLAKDIDNDGSDEIIVCSENAQVYCLDGGGRVKWHYQTKDTVYSIHCCDIDNNNDAEIILGTRDHHVYVLDWQGNFKWKYKTSRNVWSVFSDRISHPTFYDLFVTLSNHKVYYYKLIDRKNTYIKIEKSYLNLLNSEQDELSLLEDLSQEEDEYFRKFSIKTMIKFSNDYQLRGRILACLERLMKDKSALVRSASVKALIRLTDYDSEIMSTFPFEFASESNEEVRKSLIENIAKDYIRTIKPNKKKELLGCLQYLCKEWSKQGVVSHFDIFDHAKDRFFAGNFKEALTDFEVLKRRGLDLIWKEKTKGFICCIETVDIDGDGLKEIILSSSDNILYLFKHTGKLIWKKESEIGGFRSWVKVDDVDGDGVLEIIWGLSNGTFLIFTPDGQKKGQITGTEGINSFDLLATQNSVNKRIVYGCVNGYIHCIDISGQEKWRFRTGLHNLIIAVEDIDKDNSQEVIVGAIDGYVFVLDAKGREKWASKVGDDIESIVIVNLGDDEKPSIILGTDDGYIYVLDFKGEPELVQNLGSTISGIDLVHDVQNKQKDIVASNQSSHIFLLNKDGQEKKYDLRINSTISCLSCCDIDKDGYSELIVGTRDDSFYLYRILKSDEIEKFIKDCRKELAKTENRINFERKEIFRFIRDNLENNYSSSQKIILLGYLGTGKTKLLLEINSGCLGDRYIPIYISLRYMQWKDTASFLFKILKKIIDKVDIYNKEIDYYNYYKNEFEKDYRKAFDLFIKSLSSYLEHKNLLILFDDFEKLQTEVSNENLSIDVFNYLEKLSETKRCGFIITASNEVFDLEKSYEGSFLTNSIIKDVNFINKSDARMRLSRHLQGKIQNLDNTVEKIIDFTGCHINLIQVAVDEIIGYVKKNQIKRLVNKDWSIINTSITDSVDNELFNIWNRCSPHEKFFLSCLRNLKEKMYVDVDIKPHIEKELGIFAGLISLPILNEVLKSLSEKSLLDQDITEDKVQYVFTIPLLREWIYKTKDPFEIIAENSIPLLEKLSFDQFLDLDNQLKEQGKVNFFLSAIDFDAKRWDTLVTSSGIWSELLKRDTIYHNKTDKLYELIENFGNLFDFAIDDVIFHPRMTYFKFKTMPSIIQRLKNLVLIIPKSEKIDIFFYEALIALIIDQDAASNVFLIMELAVSSAFRKRCHESKVDLVLMNQRDIKRILLAPNYLHALQEKVILKQVDLVQFSPYVTTEPVVGKMFFGRLPEVRKIEHKSDKSFAIFGARQLGKTSLLRKVQERIMNSKNTKTLYIDCETYNDPADSSLRLCTDILNELSFYDGDIYDISQFRSIIKKNCQKEKIKVSLFLDEIDEILAEDIKRNEPLFRTFRALSQEGEINLIIAGYQTLFRATNELKSPLFNFLEVIRLGRLDPKSAAQLIVEPMTDLGIELQNKNMIVDEICKITGCYPNLIQCMCKRITEIIASEKRRKILENDVIRVTNDNDFQGYIIRCFYHHLSELEKVIILSLVNNDIFGPFDIEKKLKNYGISLIHRELYREIETLCMLSIFTKQVKKYKFTLPYLSKILKQTMEIELELEKLVREIVHHDH